MAGGIELSTGFDVFTNLPLDLRDIQPNIAARDAIDPLVRYVGMFCKVLDDGSGEQKLFWLKGGITNGDWEEFSGGGSGSGVKDVADETERLAVPTEDRKDGMLVYQLDTGITWQLQKGIANGNYVALDYIRDTTPIAGSGSTTNINPIAANKLEITVEPTAHGQVFYIAAPTIGGRTLKIVNSSGFRATISPQGGQGFTIEPSSGATLISGYLTWNAITEVGELLVMPVQTFSANGVATLAYTARQIIRLESTNTVERVVTLPAPDSTQKELFITGTSDNFPIKILGITLTSDKTLHIVNVGGVWKMVQGA